VSGNLPTTRSSVLILITTLTALRPENASWHTRGRSRIVGDHMGRDAVFAQFGRYGGETNGAFKAVLTRVC
jgi:uncharacterized protein